MKCAVRQLARNLNIKFICKVLHYLLVSLPMSFFETQAELANLPNLSNSVKIKNHLNVSKVKM